MGNSGSNQQVLHNKQSSHDIQKRIRHIFLNDNKNGHINETIGWRDSDVTRDPLPDAYGNATLQGGAKLQSRRNRYDKFDLKHVIDAQKGGASGALNHNEDYHEMGSEFSELNKVKAYLEKDVRMGLNMEGGCGCSNPDGVHSATSSAFVNNAVMKGGANDDKKKSQKRQKSKRDELDEIDDEDILDDADDNDNDNDNDDDDDDDDSDDDNDNDDDDDDSNGTIIMSRTPTTSSKYPKRGRKGKNAKLSDYSYTSSQANRSEDININPFLSSDSDNLKHLQSKNRFN